ncbi:hypothetical protein [Nocardia veterana]|uniref:Uncharacterized protein n=1 Tax=Nocardia veterana TaxID=132249 RepID=A0A7X6RIQ9_9NOCA|nr:hypothetical protein [Nocardia veterana]NKY87396.1 hypothetical protein [Nocardia veterana]
MNDLDAVLGEIHRSETRVGRLLIRTADRHRTDHEVHHVCRDLLVWTDEHRRSLAETGHRRGVRLNPAPLSSGGPVEALRRRLADLVGRRHAPSLLLLRDLRSIHKQAAVVSVNWEILAQAAQAAEDSDLLELASRCHPETLRQLRWANAKIKETAPQAVATP